MVLRARTANLERTYTAAEFEKLAEFNERYELIEGRLVEKPMPKYEHGYISRLLLRAYDRFDMEEKIGVMLAEVSVRVRDNYTPTPDLSFWTTERKPARKISIAPTPNLAIEIQSEGQAVKDLYAKASEYLRAGVELVWVIEPAKTLVTVFRQGQDNPTIVQSDGELDGYELIPGFKLKVADLFD